MKRHLIAALAATALAPLPALAFAETRTLDVATFHGVDAASGIRAVVSGGQPLSVVADAAKTQDLDDLRYEVRDGILHLWYQWTIGDIFDWSGRDITITIGTEVLDALEASSGASVEAVALMGEEVSLEASSGGSIKTNAIEGMVYAIEASSGARIETSGLCTSANVEVSSGASIGAKELDCARVSLEASSGASVEITARESIAAEVSSGGHATVFGKPGIDSLETSVGGSVDFPG